MAEPILKPIPRYSKYFVDNNKKVSGFTSEGLEDITFITMITDKEVTISDFFVIDNIIYITRIVSENQGTEEEPDMQNVTYLYMQENGTTTEIEELPERPIQENENYTSTKWSIERTLLGNKLVSHVRNLYFKGIATFLNVYGSFENENGLFFNIIESGKPGVSEGLYFFPINRTSVNKIKENGEIW